MRQEFEKAEELEPLPGVQTYVPTGLSVTLIRQEAHSYLSRFAPLLYALQTEDVEECKRALETAHGLRNQGVRLLAEFERYAEPNDAELLNTLRAAVSQSETVEEQLRRRLGVLQPGSPDAQVDLAALRQGLAQVAARQELASATGTQHVDEDRIAISLSRSNWAAGAGSLLFGLGLGAFVTFHATFMIGGLYRAVGLPAFFLLLFYSLFYIAVFALLTNAVQAISNQDLTLEGRELTIFSRLGPFSWEKKWRIGPDSRASLSLVTKQNRGRPMTEIAAVDADGREFRFGRFMPEPTKMNTVERLNRYFSRLRRTL